MTPMDAKLKQDALLLAKQIYWLNLSYQQCHAVGVKADYSIEEFGYFETLCSRYSRSMDFLIRKMFRTLDEYELENQGTLIDVVNRAHKRQLFDDVDEIRLMKDIRNTIVHEYIEDELVDVFDEVLQYSQRLLEIMGNTQAYMNKLLEATL